MLWFEYFNGYLNLEIPGVFVIAYVASLANAFIEDLTSSSGLHFSYHTVSQYAGYYWGSFLLLFCSFHAGCLLLGQAELLVFKVTDTALLPMVQIIAWWPCFIMKYLRSPWVFSIFYSFTNLIESFLRSCVKWWVQDCKYICLISTSPRTSESGTSLFQTCWILCLLDTRNHVAPGNHWTSVSRSLDTWSH